MSAEVVRMVPVPRSAEMGSRIQTAYHEAGHAVVGRVLGIISKGCTIVPDDDRQTEGTSDHGDPLEDYGAWEARGKLRDPCSVYRAHIMTTYAGGLAEEIFCGKAFGRGWGTLSDLTDITLLLNHADLPEGRRDWLRDRTRTILRRHREAVTRVAEALLGRGTLTQEECDRIAGIAPPRVYPTVWDGAS